MPSFNLATPASSTIQDNSGGYISTQTDKATHPSSISVFSMDLKRIQAPHSLFRDFGADKTLKSKFKPLLVIWQSFLKDIPEDNQRFACKIYGWALVIFSSVLTDVAQMKRIKQKFGLWLNSNIYVNFLSLSSTWQFFIIQWLNPTEMFWNCLFKAMAGKFSKPTTVEKMGKLIPIVWSFNVLSQISKLS